MAIMETTQLPLADRFAVQREAFANRASAIFPVLIRADCDTVVVFLDYWRLKNGVESIACFLRVYDAAGSIVLRQAHAMAPFHNEISLAALLGRADFEGMVEVEFVSPRNLTFNYPAIAVFYRSADCYSAVHAPGRVRNPDEARRPSRSLETNWTCKAGGGVTPFFHVFNGPRAGTLAGSTVSLRDPAGEVFDSRTTDFGLEAPFSSRIVKVDELFDLGERRDGDFFITVDIPDDDCFPRLVVGNYHRDREFLEATHSFYWTAVDDFLARDGDGRPDLLSFIPATNIPDLGLDLTFYPTNTAAKLVAGVRSAQGDGRLEATGRTVAWKSGGVGARVWRERLDPATSLLSFDFEEGTVPSRLNTSYGYSVRAAGSRFSTDIATGAHAFVYPPKFSHWGHGLVSDEFETVLMIRNISHNRATARAASASLRVFDASQRETTATVRVESEAAQFVRLRDLVGGGNDVRTLSWFLRSDCPDLEAFWICWSPQGSICGEHAF